AYAASSYNGSVIRILERAGMATHTARVFANIVAQEPGHPLGRLTVKRLVSLGVFVLVFPSRRLGQRDTRAAVERRPRTLVADHALCVLVLVRDVLVPRRDGVLRLD